MSESRDDPEIFWVDPRLRGIFPLDQFRISRSLARHMRKSSLRVTFDQDFTGVMQGCADRSETWINATIIELYSTLFGQGDAHSVEVWEDDVLVGGVYGVTIGAAFFGESMFSKRTNASKMALAYLVDRLKSAGFKLFDTQFITPHLLSLGAIEISREDYQRRLAIATIGSADFGPAGSAPDAYSVLQRSAQTS